MQTGYSRYNTQSDVQFDQGLRQLMLTMYNHTASGLAVSGAVAWLTYSSGLMYAMGSLLYVAMFAPLGMIFTASSQMPFCAICQKLSVYEDKSMGKLL